MAKSTPKQIQSMIDDLVAYQKKCRAEANNCHSWMAQQRWLLAAGQAGDDILSLRADLKTLQNKGK